jgi:hypothetical protein
MLDGYVTIYCVYQVKYQIWSNSVQKNEIKHVRQPQYLFNLENAKNFDVDAHEK